KILRRKARIEVAEHNLVHIFGTYSGVGKRVAGHPHNQAFNRFIVKLTEGGVGPPDNTGGHRCLLCRILVAFLGDDLRVTIYVHAPVPDFSYHPKLRETSTGG